MILLKQTNEKQKHKKHQHFIFVQCKQKQSYLAIANKCKYKCLNTTYIRSRTWWNTMRQRPPVLPKLTLCFLLQEVSNNKKINIPDLARLFVVVVVCCLSFWFVCAFSCLFICLCSQHYKRFCHICLTDKQISDVQNSIYNAIQFWSPCSKICRFSLGKMDNPIIYEKDNNDNFGFIIQ